MPVTNVLCKVWLKFILWFWRRLLNWIELKKNLYPQYQRMFYAIGLLVYWLWRRRWKREKSSQIDECTNRHSEKLNWAFSSGELKTITHLILIQVMPKTLILLRKFSTFVLSWHLSVLIGNFFSPFVLFCDHHLYTCQVYVICCAEWI